MEAKKPKGAVESEGRMRFHAAETSTVVATTPKGTFKLFKLAFSKDGSIHVPFPYLNAKRGVLSHADPAVEPDPKELHLQRDGVVVDYDVKFTHHSTGFSHFTKRGPREEDELRDGGSEIAPEPFEQRGGESAAIWCGNQAR